MSQWVTTTLTVLIMGGGARYPYPKHVWSPAGGWWSQPSNWKMNTFIVCCGMGLVCGAIIRGVAHREAELAGEPLERRRFSTFLREHIHKSAAEIRAKKVAAADAAAEASKSD
ncbi:hypothetical protein B0H13DRAFT_2306182 [Mycena leptocephala]|nr:hypothetical protein B0H13DRAFT_2306182 [Mycena leptocephala]